MASRSISSREPGAKRGEGRRRRRSERRAGRDGRRRRGGVVEGYFGRGMKRKVRRNKKLTIPSVRVAVRHEPLYALK
jgi:hypothetical protein